ncbi:MAG: 5-formyltetrahydrofolate cyclo-ligase [Candidatus Solincola sediminis]|uniref:5-formyltetrahydrofolate cyclo-ligase n=1 Tax=Candidatus Solincola sediminis TaxID=1797199 RepID=A0A1F2WJ82_9ACTN|nr:MAG: 5-formyltetrahydrofolate cyclo-ligase [Candidatus Solincola sediminis]
MVNEKKKALRKKIQALRDGVSTEERDALSARVADNLWSLPEFESARSILFFISFRSEVNTVPMIERSIAGGKITCLPCTDMKSRGMIASQVLDLGKDLVLGNYDIMEPRQEAIRPVAAERIDIVLMPGVAFDEGGGRLGYGGGYYDRFLEKCRPDCRLIALAFELQLVDEVPRAEHDRLIHTIVTERRIIACPVSAIGPDQF